MLRLTALLAAFAVASVALFACHDGCELGDYQPQEIALVSGAPSVGVHDGICVIRTDLPVDVTNPDQHGPKLEHIGESVFKCLNGAVTSTAELGQPFYQEQLWFKINGQCPDNYYGCFSHDCRTIETNLSHIGGNCPDGTPMDNWDQACWQQFHAVLGHEIMHGWLGRFHE